MNDAVITLNLKVSEVNLLLEGAGHMPYARVEGVIALVRNQALPQLSAQTPPPELPADALREDVASA